ncbi:Uncharacterised protein [Mycobacteroides abscessus subsp. abscessus]|nr:Uncharacterised protein [Mycobacteroides abscessus subsp. abscessus]
MAEEEVRSSLHRSSAVTAIRADLESQIASGRLSALEGVHQLLQVWKKDVTDGHVGMLEV